MARHKIDFFLIFSKRGLIGSVGNFRCRCWKISNFTDSYWSSEVLVTQLRSRRDKIDTDFTEILQHSRKTHKLATSEKKLFFQFQIFSNFFLISNFFKLFFSLKYKKYTKKFLKYKKFIFVSKIQKAARNRSREIDI